MPPAYAPPPGYVAPASAAGVRRAPALRPPPPVYPPPVYRPYRTAPARTGTRRPPYRYAAARTTLPYPPPRSATSSTVRSRSAAASASAVSSSRPVSTGQRSVHRDGLSYTFRLGFGLRPGLLLLWDVEGAVGELRHRRRSSQTANLVALQIFCTQRLFLKGGFGFAGASTGQPADPVGRRRRWAASATS